MARHPTEAPTREEAEVYLRRFQEARAAGLTRLEARMFAECDRDVGELRRLVELGCAPKLMADILI